MLTAFEVAELLQAKLLGDKEAEVIDICPVAESHPDSTAIVLSKGDMKHIAHCRAKIIIGPQAVQSSKALTKIIVPKLQAQALNQVLRAYKVEKYHLYDQGNVSVSST